MYRVLNVQNFKTFTPLFFIPLYDSDGVLWFHVGHSCVRASISHLSIFLFPDIIWVNVSWFSSDLVCVLMLWRSALGLLTSKICQFFTELSSHHIIVAGYYRCMFLVNSFFYFSITGCLTVGEPNISEYTHRGCGRWSECLAGTCCYRCWIQGNNF